MTDNFDAFLDSYGPVTDEELEKDIDEIIAERKANLLQGYEVGNEKLYD
jgi:hypothetical protein